MAATERPVTLTAGAQRRKDALTVGPSPAEVGERLRERRKELSLSVRELARRVAVSPSLISQIENGKTSPSVGTLYAIVSEMDLSLDEVFSGTGESRRGGDGSRDPRSPVVTEDERKEISLGSGVRWQRLTRVADPNVDFLHLIYEPGSASCPEDHLMRHAGQEYGYVISGRLSVTIGFDTYELTSGDSISFDSTQPHRLAAVGDEPMYAIWTVIGRFGDPRL
jgi:transcriptional regulator with XRE-family HTH domain